MSHQKKAVASRGTAELEKGIEGEGRVPHPGEAIVPVALATDRLRQRGRGGGGDRSGGREHEQLQREGAAQDRVSPGAVVGPARGPGSPEPLRVSKAPLHLRPSREYQRLAVRACDRDQGLVARGDLEATGHGVPTVFGQARRPVADGERFTPHGRHRHFAAALDTRPLGAIGKARLHPPAHRHPAGQPLDPANKLPFRSKYLSGERHRVGDACRTLRGGERRLEQVGVGQVSPLDLIRRLGLEREAARLDPGRGWRRRRSASRDWAGRASRSSRRGPPEPPCDRRRSQRSPAAARNPPATYLRPAHGFVCAAVMSTSTERCLAFIGARGYPAGMYAPKPSAPRRCRSLRRASCSVL